MKGIWERCGTTETQQLHIPIISNKPSSFVNEQRLKVDVPKLMISDSSSPRLLFSGVDNNQAFGSLNKGTEYITRNPGFPQRLILNTLSDASASRLRIALPDGLRETVAKGDSHCIYSVSHPGGSKHQAQSRSVTPPHNTIYTQLSNTTPERLRSRRKSSGYLVITCMSHDMKHQDSQFIILNNC